MRASPLRRFGVAALIAIAVSLGMASPVAANTPDDAESAVEAYNAAYWSSSVPAFYRWSDRTVRPDWTMGESFDVILDAYERTGSPAYRAQIDQIYTFLVSSNGWGPTSNWYQITFDDALWTILPMLRAYQITGDTKFLTPAVAEWNYIYDHGHDDVLGGGLYWHIDTPTLKSANTNGGAAIAGFQIADITGDNTYRTKSLAIVDWMIANLYDPVTGQVYNQKNTDGSVQKNDWSYNYGIFIGALDAAYRYTRNSAYRAHAIKALDYVKNYDPARPSDRFPGTNNMTQPSGLLSDEIYNKNSAVFKQDIIRWIGRFIYNNNLTDYLPWLQFNATVAWSHRRADNLMGYSSTTKTDPDFGGPLAMSMFGAPASTGKLSDHASLPGVEAVLAMPSDGTNVAPDATVTASSYYQNSSQYAPRTTVDGTLGRHNTGEWASHGETSPWVRYDWTTPQRLNKVVLFDRMNAQDNANSGVLTFSDGSSLAVTGIQAGGFGRSITFAPRTVTWVKFQATGGTGSNVGLSELHAYAENDLAYGRPATSSSVYGTGYAVANALDNSRATRFSSASGDGAEWFRVDLGSSQTVDTVEVDWDAAYAKNYTIAVSTDGTNYTTVANRSGIIHPGPTTDRFAPVTARYVKITMTNGYRPTGRNFSFWSFKVLDQP